MPISLNDDIKFTTITTGTIAASGSYTSEAIDLTRVDDAQQGLVAASGFFSVDVVITGSGTGKLELLCTNAGITWSIPEGMYSIMSGKTAGTYFASFSCPICKSFKIKFTETGAANSISCVATVAMM